MKFRKKKKIRLKVNKTAEDGRMNEELRGMCKKDLIKMKENRQLRGTA